MMHAKQLQVCLQQCHTIQCSMEWGVQIMHDMISRHHNGFKPSFYHDLRVKLLN